MEYLAVQDVREIVNLLGKVAVEEANLQEKRRCLMNGLAKIVNADIWIWLQVRDDGPGRNSMAFMALHDGWESEAAFLKFTEGSVSPAVTIVNDRLRNLEFRDPPLRCKPSPVIGSLLRPKAPTPQADGMKAYTASARTSIREVAGSTTLLVVRRSRQTEWFLNQPAAVLR